MSSPTYYAIVLHSQCSDKAAQFIFDNLVLSYERGGGGLEVRRQVASHNKELRNFDITNTKRIAGHPKIFD